MFAPEPLLVFDLSTLLLRLRPLLTSFDLETLLLPLSLPLPFPLSVFLDESFLIGFTFALLPFDMLLCLDFDLSSLVRTLGAKADFFSLLLEETFFDVYLDLELSFLPDEDFLVLLSLLLLLFRPLDDFGRPTLALLSLTSLALLVLLLREDFGRPLLTSFDPLTLLLFDLLDFLVRDLFKYFDPSSRVAAIVLVRTIFREESPLLSPYLTLK